MNIEKDVILVGPLPPPIGGQTILVNEISQYYMKNGKDIFVFDISHKIKISLIRFIFSVLLLIKFFYILLIRKNKIIHIHSSAGKPLLEKVLFAMIGKLFRRKVLLHVHGGKMKVLWNSYGKLARMSITFLINTMFDAVIVLSKDWEQFYSNEMKLNCKIYIVPNAVNFNKENKVTIKKNISKITFIGSICREKGIIDLLLALDQAAYTSISVNLVGLIEPSNEVEIRSCLEGLNYLNVLMPGIRMGREKWNELLDSDVFILPSHSEDLPISIIEAICVGLPIIATDVGCVSDIVHDGANGLLIEPRNPEQIRIAVDKMIDGFELRKKMHASNISLRKQFNFESYADRLEVAYNDLLAS